MAPHPEALASSARMSRLEAVPDRTGRFAPPLGLTPVSAGVSSGTGRAAVLEALRAVSDGAYVGRAFDAVGGRLDARERRWARECVYGVLRHRGRLDHLLAHRVRGGLARLDPTVLDLLRSGAHQILHMDSVPPYAAVSESVDQARSVAGEGAAGLANAVLRKVADGGLASALFPSPDQEPVAYLASWYSHPAWLVRRWLERWPREDVAALLAANLAVPGVFLHPLGGTQEEAIRALGAGATAAGNGSGCVLLPPGLLPVEALDRVRGIIQDPGAALVTHYADLEPGGLVADLCAAPGGKAFAMAEEAGTVLAADRSLRRLDRVRQTARRLGSPVHPVVADARRPPLDLARAVLVDVPCSGTGTLRRRPDLKWRLTPGGIESLVGLQRSILEGASAAVEPGGLLVYSTCTLEPEENREQVAWFLDRHEEFQLEATSAVRSTLLDDTGALVVMPHRTGFDGAYAARMRRTA